MYHQVIYTSYAPSNFCAEDLKQILAASQRNNPKIQVTGLLIMKGGLFIQILEGPHAAVKELYSKILTDKRHIGAKIIWECSKMQRDFEHWSMAYKESQDIEIEWVNTLLALAQARDEASSIMKKLAKEI